jgi:lipid A disaccharide synthetase
MLNNKNICSAAAHWNVLEYFSVNILNNLNSIKNMLRESLNLNFITIKSNELLADKGREKLHEECDKLCAGINYIYNMYLAYLDKY